MADAPKRTRHCDKFPPKSPCCGVILTQRMRRVLDKETGRTKCGGWFYACSNRQCRSGYYFSPETQLEPVMVTAPDGILMTLGRFLDEGGLIEMINPKELAA